MGKKITDPYELFDTKSKKRLGTGLIDELVKTNYLLGISKYVENKNNHLYFNKEFNVVEYKK